MAEPELKGLNPRKRFWLMVAISNLDGSMEFGSEMPEEYGDVDSAIKAAVDQTEEIGDPCEYFVYECRPVKRVTRGKVKVRDVKEVE
jgi:hypothetical protein